MAVADGAVVLAHDAANVVEAGDTGVGEGDATDVGAVSHSENALE